jgi:HTH-type transcriptional regulator/antitoxin HipB
MSSIAEKLKQLRLESGMSQDKLAEHLLVSRQAISKWENGETLPDMENMIALAKLYGVSLDELVGIAVNKKENPDADNAGNNNADGNDDPSYINADIKKDGENLRINLNGINIKVKGGGKNITINGNESDSDIFDDLDDTFDDIDDSFDNLDEDLGDIDDEDVNIHIGGNIQIDEDGIDINNGRVKIDKDGININNGKVRIDSSGVIIDDDEKKKSGFIKFLYAFPYPLVVTIGFFLLGALANAWWIAWILFCTIPVYYSLVTCIHKRKFTPFAYSVFSTCIYLYIGMAYKMWHPGWIIFLTIPVYHAIAVALDKFIKNHKK